MLLVRSASRDEVRAVQSAVLRPDGPLPGDSAHPPDWLHVAAQVDGRIVGACSVGPAAWQHGDVAQLPTPQWQLRSMAVLPQFRGGVGGALLAAAMTAARDAGAACLWANARVRALGLYTRAGWQVVGDEWMKPGVGAHRWVVVRFAA